MTDSANVRKIISALGGESNIKQVEACLTRLRVRLNDNHVLNKSALKTLGAVDVVKVGDMYQMIFGAESTRYRDEINAILAR